MSIYVIGDLHLSFDPAVDKPMDVFGDSWIDHWRRLEENWRRKITDGDTVIIAGDISWALKLDEALADLAWIDGLPGEKVILKGNHDLWWSGIRKMNSLFDSVSFMQNTCHMVGDTAICGSRGWICPGSEGFSDDDMKIYRRELLRLEMSLKDAAEKGADKIIGVLHYPPLNDKKQMSGFTDLFEKYGVRKVYFGHLHGQDAKKNRSPVSVNGISYRLVSLDGVDCDPVRVDV